MVRANGSTVTASARRGDEAAKPAQRHAGPYGASFDGTDPDGRPTKGLTFERRWTRPDVHPYDEITWEYRTAGISSETGKSVFEQKDVEVPAFWSQLATNVVVSKYFRGHLGTPERETSVRQLIDRVVNTIANWAETQRYFATDEDLAAFKAELTHLIVHQKMAFNSPVWFNVGIEERPQCSACFINSVQDTMSSIMDLAKTEAMLFKFGSGAGSNLSTIRSSREKMHGGGTASGPVSFMKGYDAFAGVVKSGGKTRRAAKMVILDAGHPDVMDFIDSKLNEEKKAWALIEAGYDPSFTGEAYGSVAFQNANHSVRVTDEFMRTVENDGDWTTHAIVSGEPMETYKARDIFHRMAAAAHVCGDPGIQYDTTINDWNPVSNSARQYATNPCSEFSFLNDTSCNLASVNLMKFVRQDGEFSVDDYRYACRLTITAQEILVDNASYPTPRIEENSHRFRPLGLGYANLGALLMSRGLAYDSDEGRNFAGALTAIMHGEAYMQSAVIARDHGGPFQEYGKNREPFLGVVEAHREAAHQISSAGVPADLLAEAYRVSDEALDLGRKHGYRNAQVTLLAPTGCLVGDSLVLTDRGLVRLRGLGNPDGDKWQDLDLTVATDDGPRAATKFYVNGVEPVVSVETSRGYRIQGTTTHRIRVVDEAGDWHWRRFADIRAGDRVPLQVGGMVGEPRDVALPPLAEAYWTSDHRTFVPRTVSAELAELVGYFMGDGSLHARGLRFCVAQTDTDVVDRLVELGGRLFGITAATTPRAGYTEVRLDSVRLALWWEACGFAKHAPTTEHRGKGYEAHIPDAVLYTNNPASYRAFVRGLFEADGNVNHGYVSWTTVSERFSRDVQSLLLALGYVTTRKVDQPSRGHLGANPMQVLRLLNVSAGARFLADVSFISERKREALIESGLAQTTRHDLIPVSRATVDRLAPDNDHLRRTMLLSLSRTGLVSRRSATALLERTADPELADSLGYFYDQIASTKLGEEQYTYDLSVPANVTYVANGFVSHNTIAFMMDCDTTGVEPDIALIKYKKLV
ncbi:MAG: adenosylcobalamin-dependent ribonucleoside-diphosphate reductase, partial [Candidatus Limnocylindrales bacterium]